MALSLNNLSLGLDVGQLLGGLFGGDGLGNDQGSAGDHEVMNLAQYRRLVSNFSRPYMFLIEIPYLGKKQKTTIFCSSTSLPAFKIETSQIKFQDQRLNLGSVARFEDTWQVEFLLDEEHSIRNALLQWGSAIYNISTNTHGSPQGYKADSLKVVQLDRNGKIICGCTFVGAFPTNIGQVSLTQSSTNDVSRFTVDFTYDYWIMHEAKFPKEPGDELGDENGIFGGINAIFGNGPGGNIIGGALGGSLGGLGLNVGGAFGF